MKMTMKKIEKILRKVSRVLGGIILLKEFGLILVIIAKWKYNTIQVSITV